jgi:hypothetical protein
VAGWAARVHAAAAGSMRVRSSRKGAIVSRVMWRARCTYHSSFCSSRIAPTRRVIRRLRSTDVDLLVGVPPVVCWADAPSDGLLMQSVYPETF